MNGNFTTENNISVFNKVTQKFIDEPAIIMMKDIGSPLRIGEYKELSAQEICDLCNYLQNYTIGKEKWEEIKSYNEVQMKGFLKWITNI